MQDSRWDLYLPQQDHKREYSLDTALLLVLALGISYAAMLACLLCNFQPKASVLAPTAAIFTVIVGAVFYRSSLWFTRLSFVLAFLGAAASLAASTAILDTSYDGQVYHILAVNAIKEGWNPLYHSSFPSSIWIEHYPKAPWLLAAFICAHVPSIEAGKAVNVISFLASFAAAHAAVCTVFKGRPRWLLLAAAAAMAANPVVFAELFTYYNDGLLGSLLLIYIAALACYAVSFERKPLILAAVTLLLLLNIKFTAVIYAGLITIIFLIYVAIVKRSRVIPVLMALGLTATSAMLVFGFNPYVSNSVNKGHPFYPVAGPQKIDIISANEPADFIGKGRLEKMALALTGKTGNPVQPMSSERRNLFFLTPTDIKTEFRHMAQDNRIGGFGPFMFWIVLCSIAVGLLLLMLDWRKALAGMLATAALMTTVLVNPESWWARYVPQFWLLPVVIALCGWVQRRKMLKTASILLMLLICLNALGSGYRLVHLQMLNSWQLNARMDELRENPLQLHPEGAGFVSVPIRMQEKGILFTYAADELSCKQPQQIPFSVVHYCNQALPRP